MEASIEPGNAGAGDSLHTPGFQDNQQRDIKKKPAAVVAAAGSVFEVKGSHSMLNDSTRAFIRKSDISDTDTKSLNRQTGLLGKPSDDNLPDKFINSLGRFIRGENVILSKLRGPDYGTGGAYESLGKLSSRLKGVTDSGQAKELFRGVKAEFEGDDLQLGWLSEVEAIAFPHEPLPVEFGGRRIGATRADFLKVRSSTRYAWPGWIIGGAVNAIAANGGVGKSRFVFDLCARVYRGTEWPDGTPVDESMKGKAALWVPSDGNYEQLFDLIDSYELPDDSTIFIGTPDEPYGPTNLDSSDTAAFIREIVESRPIWAVIIDTIARCTTSPNPYGDEVLTRMLNPLRALLEPMGIPLIVLSHLNKEGVLKGRTLIGAARSVIMMTDEPGDKKRIYVDKTQGIKPQHLIGVMRDDSFSFEPASEPINRTEPSNLKGPEKTAYDYLLSNPGSTFQEIIDHVASSIDGNVEETKRVERAKQAFYRMRQRVGATKDDSKPPKWFLDDPL